METGWIPLDITKKRSGELQIAKESPQPPVGRSGEEKRVQGGLETDQRILYPGDRTCPVKGTDFSGGTPDWTCPVRAEIPERDRVLNNSLDLLNI
jgi:hypothetical protein